MGVAGCIENRTNIDNNTFLFSVKSFKKITEIMDEHTFSAGSILFCEGDLANQLYFVKNGSVRLMKTTDDGKELTLYYFHDGDLIHNMDVSERNISSFSAEVLQHSVIGIVKRSDLEQLLWKNGDLAVEFIRWLSYMQRFMQLKLRDLLFHGKHGALASTLIRIANTYGVFDGKVIRFTEKFTHAELASLIGATRETVNRMLSQFKKDELIDYHKGRIVILNLEGLKKICHCESCPLTICRL